MHIQQSLSPQHAFPFIANQYQKILAMIRSSSHGFQGQGNMTASKDTIMAMANNVSTTAPLTSIPFNLKHSIFAAKVVN